jgi:phosphoadenosine phosphosulfate reductase
MTGGLLLNLEPTGFSKEPRPVYATELDLLGFDKYWKYDKQTDYPYLWAELNNYYYRGKLVAKLKGGNAFTAPEIIIPKGDDNEFVMPEPNGDSLCQIDIQGMVDANYGILEIIEQYTVKKILAIYGKHKNHLDCFHVAFSGGKDSCVLLDLVKKTLPKGSYVVVFGDTAMEFPDTYDVVRKTKEMCSKENISFSIANSSLMPAESWKLFGPPSRTLSWCCSVHKSTPQVLKLREITGKHNYTGMAFVGIRAHESSNRAEYEYENYGNKVKGQYIFYPMLEWTSAEVYLYAYSNNIILNDAYKKGNSRAGCLVCPKAGGASDYIRRITYPDKVAEYFRIIRESCDTFDDTRFCEYMNKGEWKSRVNGLYLKGTIKKYREDVTDGIVRITVINPLSEYREWIKTMDWDIPFTVEKTDTGYIVTVSEIDLKSNHLKAKIFKQVFKKAAYCGACGVCAANCRNGCISFENKTIKIDNCRHCLDCHTIPGGCILYDSLKIPNGGAKMRSINSFATFPPKPEWLVSFFNNKDEFFKLNSLGPQQEIKFKVFLVDAGLSVNNHFSKFADLISFIGWRTVTSMGLILINLVAANPQIEWYVKKLDLDHTYSLKDAQNMLMSDGLKERNAADVARAFKRIVATPLGTVLRFGIVTDVNEIIRTPCVTIDHRVILYGLFKFAEKCNNYKEFTLTTLVNNKIVRDGVSPTRIFGIKREAMENNLLGLSAKYPDFISVSFTYDLDSISLSKNKTSQDVLNLFMEDN